MAKTLFHTSDKSNFILNLHLDTYRSAAAKLLLAALWITAVSVGIHQATFDVNTDIAIMTAKGGFQGILGLLLTALRSVASLFSIAGVLTMIWCFVGIVKKQLPKTTLPCYLILVFTMAWGLLSMTQSYSNQTSLFGQDGRDEGLIALLMYATMFYLGTMLRRDSDTEQFAGGLMAFGIFQNLWALLQTLPFFDFPSAYKMVDPLLYQNLRLPSGLTDSPVTFAMLSAMLLAVAIPASVCAKSKLTRILAVICMTGSLLLVFKTQTIAGWIAGIGALVIAAVTAVVRRGKQPGKGWRMPVICFAAAACSLVWAFFSPAINKSYQTWNDERLSNGFYLFDGGIVWDDSFYRLSTSGPYQSYVDHDFEIKDTVSVIRYCWKEGFRIIQIDPLFGVGPDNWFYTQLHSSMELIQNGNTIDRPYNDWIFITATRGIPALLSHIALIVCAAILAWRRRKQNWMIPAACAGAILYTLTSMAGISVLSAAPLFWMLLGIAASEPLPDAPPKVRQPKQKKKKQQTPDETTA